MFDTDLLTDLNWLDHVSLSLDRFSKVYSSSNTYNCRCPVCGDSDQSKRKARFYFYTRNDNLNVDCKNCGYHGSFWKFMKDVFPNEFPSYKREQMLERFNTSSRKAHKGSRDNRSRGGKGQTQKATQRPLKGYLKDTVPMSELSDDHSAVQYLKSRCFGDRQIKRLLYTDNFREAANTISENELSENFPNDSRIVIPFYDSQGENIEMIQGRSINPKSGLRYISIKSHEDVDKVYGKYELDSNKTSYCVEGPFDSLFVDNCLATCDSTLPRSKADVMIWDNEPRSEEIVSLMSNWIELGGKLVIWPGSPEKKLDINDMIQMGLSQKQLMEVIHSRVFQGIRAKIEFKQWKRV